MVITLYPMLNEKMRLVCGQLILGHFCIDFNDRFAVSVGPGQMNQARYWNLQTGQCVKLIQQDGGFTCVKAFFA
jgi:hypothetical protein